MSSSFQGERSFFHAILTMRETLVFSRKSNNSRAPSGRDSLPAVGSVGGCQQPTGTQRFRANQAEFVGFWAGPAWRVSSVARRVSGRATKEGVILTRESLSDSEPVGGPGASGFATHFLIPGNLRRAALDCAARGAVARWAAPRSAADGKRAAKNSPRCAARFFWLSRDRTLISFIAP